MRVDARHLWWLMVGLSNAHALPGFCATAAPKAAKVDVQIRKAGDPNYLGEDVFNNDGTNQGVSGTALPGTIATYQVKIKNNDSVPANLKVTGTALSKGWIAQYFDALDGRHDITTAVTSTTGWTTPLLRPGLSLEMLVTVIPGKTVPNEEIRDVLITASVPRSDQGDTVLISTQRIQWVAGLKYSLDQGTTWTAVPKGDKLVTIDAYAQEIVLLKVIKHSGLGEWPRDRPVLIIDDKEFGAVDEVAMDFGEYARPDTDLHLFTVVDDVPWKLQIRLKPARAMDGG